MCINSCRLNRFSSFSENLHTHYTTRNHPTTWRLTATFRRKYDPRIRTPTREHLAQEIVDQIGSGIRYTFFQKSKKSFYHWNFFVAVWRIFVWQNTQNQELSTLTLILRSPFGRKESLQGQRWKSSNTLLWDVWPKSGKERGRRGDFYWLRENSLCIRAALLSLHQIDWLQKTFQ